GGTTMNAHEIADLRARLAAFVLDDPAVDYPFTARLARDNGWSRAFALRVADEYKRFVLLCQISDRPPCPSEQVDEAWHLHLTYTRSYWNDLCGQVLRRPLHHEPTKGGNSEYEKHVALYEHTLNLYRDTFAAEPPRDIWPPANIRFGADTEHRQVNLQRNWVIPNPLARLRSWRRGAMAAPLLAVTWNPLDWQGPQFLWFFGITFLLALLTGLILRRVLRPSTEARLEPPLSPAEIAQLARGKRGTITATLCQLVSKDVLKLQATESTVLGFKTKPKQQLVAGTAQPAEPLEHALTKAIITNPNATLRELESAAGETLDRTEAELINRGLVYEPWQVFLPRWLPVMLTSLVLLVGLAKIGVGMYRDKPVGYLIIGCLVAFFVVVGLFKHIRRSKAGDQLIADLQTRHASWKAGGTPAAALGPAEIAVAVALFGTAALAGTAYASLNQWERQSWGNVGSDSSSSGCSSGCGGSGCGGGGCGGGGCGGCGGGD
ncbi:MAG: TIGR04222 domain-containing membrane protein, partial [Pirellulaceae bacterium]|nr:TIGR04222 domain-containing membrane protein [Pirellulaceae bacterium]